MGEGSTKWIIGIVAVVIVAGAGIFLATNNSDDDEPATSTTSQTSEPAQTNETENSEVESKDIVALASETSSLSTLVTAVKAGDLVSTLQGAGPFTVFAPTNDAFAALPAGTLDTLLKPENKEQLKGILTYHVVSGKVMAKDLKDGQEVTTVQGAKLTVKLMDGKAYLIDTKGTQIEITSTDIEASNGVVHVISGVLMPQ